MYDKYCTVMDSYLLTEWMKNAPLGGNMRQFEARVLGRRQSVAPQSMMQQRHASVEQLSHNNGESTGGTANVSASPAKSLDSMGINEIARRLILPHEVTPVRVWEYKAKPGAKRNNATASQTDNPISPQSNQNATLLVDTSLEQQIDPLLSSPSNKPYESAQWFDQFPVLLYFGSLWDTKSRGLIENIHGIFSKEDEGCEYKAMEDDVRMRISERKREHDELRNEVEQLRFRAQQTLGVMPTSSRNLKARDPDRVSLESLNSEALAVVREYRAKNQKLVTLTQQNSFLEQEERELDLGHKKRKAATSTGGRGDQRYLQYIAVYISLDNEEDAYQEFVDQLATGFDIGGRALAWYALDFSDSDKKQSLTKSLMQLFRVSQVPQLVYLHPIDEAFGSLPMREFSRDIIQLKIHHSFKGGEQLMEEQQKVTKDLSKSKKKKKTSASGEGTEVSLGEETKYQMEMLRTLGEERRITRRFAPQFASEKKKVIKSLHETIEEQWKEKLTPLGDSLESVIDGLSLDFLADQNLPLGGDAAGEVSQLNRSSNAFAGRVSKRTGRVEIEGAAQG